MLQTMNIQTAFSLIAGFLTIISCSSSKVGNTEIVSIKHGTSFGMCEGYCFNEVEYNKEYKIETKKNWTTSDVKVQKSNMNSTDWQQLLAIIDLKKVMSLNEIYGCPDCADQGQEWIEIKTKNTTKRIKLEFRSSEVHELNKILKILRK